MPASTIQSDAKIIVTAAGGDDEKALVARQIIDGVKAAAASEGGLDYAASSRPSSADIGWIGVQVSEDWSFVTDLRDDTVGGRDQIAGNYGNGHITTVDIRIELAEAICGMTAKP